MSIIAEKSLNAIAAGNGNGNGNGNGELGKITLVHFYDPKTDKYTAKPPSVKVGDTVGLYALGENLSGSTQLMKIRVELYDPEKQLIDSDERELEIDYPGTIGSHYVEGVTLLKGDYRGKVRLWAGDILADTKEVLVATTKPLAKFPWLWVSAGAAIIGLVAAKKKKKI